MLVPQIQVIQQIWRFIVWITIILSAANRAHTRHIFMIFIYMVYEILSFKIFLRAITAVIYLGLFMILSIHFAGITLFIHLMNFLSLFISSTSFRSLFSNSFMLSFSFLSFLSHYILNIFFLSLLLRQKQCPILLILGLLSLFFFLYGLPEVLVMDLICHSRH